MRGRRALSDDHAYPQTDQFVCKRAETVGLSFRKSILDGNILPNNVSQVAQAPLEGVSAGYHRGARVDAQKSNRDFIGCLLRARREGHAAAQPSSVMNWRRFMSLPCLGSLLSNCCATRMMSSLR